MAMDKVSLKEEQNQGVVHFIIEKFVLWRLQNWKNNPRVNALIWKAVLSVISLLAIGLLIALVLYWITSPTFPQCPVDFNKLFKDISGVDFSGWVKLGMALSGSITIAYWNMSTMFNKKWSYCADLYNTVLNAAPDRQEILRNALAVDLLTLDLWAHRSFSMLFKNELLKAIEMSYSLDHIESEQRRALSGDYTENEALKVLGFRNNKLVDESPK